MLVPEIRKPREEEYTLGELRENSVVSWSTTKKRQRSTNRRRNDEIVDGEVALVSFTTTWEPNPKGSRKVRGGDRIH